LKHLVLPFIVKVYSLNKYQRIPKEQWKRGQSRETGNIGYTRRRKTKQNTRRYVLDTTVHIQRQTT